MNKSDEDLEASSRKPAKDERLEGTIRPDIRSTPNQEKLRLAAMSVEDQTLSGSVTFVPRKKPSPQTISGIETVKTEIEEQTRSGLQTLKVQTNEATDQTRSAMTTEIPMAGSQETRSGHTTQVGSAAESSGGEDLVSNQTTHTVAGTSMTLIEQVGEGGMAKIFRAVQNSLERDIAVKTPHHSESINSYFETEAMTTGYLEHPNIVPVHDLGLTSSGEVLLSMKLVEGQDW